MPLLQDLLVNANNGYIDNRLKYLRRLKHGQSTTEVDDAENVFNNDAAVAINNLTLTERGEEDFKILKTIVVNEANMGTIKAKLTTSAEFRSNMMKNDNLSFRTEFPYFFTNPGYLLN